MAGRNGHCYGGVTIIPITGKKPGSVALAGTADVDGRLRECAHYDGDKSLSTAGRLGPVREPIDDRLPEETMRREHVPARKIALIHNGLPDEAFARRPPARIETKRPVLPCIANFKLRKGHRHLLEGLLRAAGQPARLVPMGDRGRQDALAGQARRVGTDVRFLGAQPDVGPAAHLGRRGHPAVPAGGPEPRGHGGHGSRAPDRDQRGRRDTRVAARPWRRGTAGSHDPGLGCAGTAS